MSAAWTGPYACACGWRAWFVCVCLPCAWCVWYVRRSECFGRVCFFVQQRFFFAPCVLTFLSFGFVIGSFWLFLATRDHFNHDVDVWSRSWTQPWHCKQADKEQQLLLLRMAWCRSCRCNSSRSACSLPFSVLSAGHRPFIFEVDFKVSIDRSIGQKYSWRM